MQQDGFARIGQGVIERVARGETPRQIGDNHAERMFGVSRFNGNWVAHHCTSLLQTGLLANRLHEALPQILLRMKDRDRAGSGRMHKLMVAAVGTVELPAIGLQHLDQLRLCIVCFVHTDGGSGQCDGPVIRGSGRLFPEPCRERVPSDCCWANAGSTEVSCPVQQTMF